MAFNGKNRSTQNQNQGPNSGLNDSKLQLQSPIFYESSIINPRVFLLKAYSNYQNLVNE